MEDLAWIVLGLIAVVAISISVNLFEEGVLHSILLAWLQPDPEEDSQASDLFCYEGHIPIREGHEPGRGSKMMVESR